MSKKKHADVPLIKEFYQPVVKALTELGGSGYINEINDKVYKIMNLDEEIISRPREANDGRTLVEYRLAWARTHLKLIGVLENSARSVWSLIKSDLNFAKISPDTLEKAVRNAIESKNAPKDKKLDATAINIVADENLEEVAPWKDTLLNKLYTIEPSAFERLAQRLLRESGFIQVEVTGKTGDGGIDGKGIVRINGFLSFHVIFQCKRYKSSVSPSQIRDFRGAMQGRADKGLFITTGTFTREATKEATRDGAPPIDLIDGELLCEKLKELRLGIDIELVEKINLQLEWFDKL